MYLTKILKKYYLDDLNAIKKSTCSFWKINGAILRYIDKINNNESIQTIYSKYPEKGDGYLLESYIYFAYTEDVESAIFKEFLPYVIREFNSDDTFYCYYLFEKARVLEDKKKLIKDLISNVLMIQGTLILIIS